jgi:hypothetical protein
MTGTFAGFELLRPLEARGGIELWEARGRTPMGPRDLLVARVDARDPATRGAAHLEAAASLSSTAEHALLPPLVERGEVDGVPYLAFEQPDGPSLAELASKRMRAGEPFPVRAALELTDALLAFLATLHERRGQRGALPGPLSPRDLRICDLGAPKLAGFWLAVLGPEAPPGAGDDLLAGATVAGDLFAVGALVAELLAAEYPSLRERTPSARAELLPGMRELPVPLSRALIALTARQADERPATARAARELLVGAEAHVDDEGLLALLAGDEAPSARPAEPAGAPVPQVRGGEGSSSSERRAKARLGAAGGARRLGLLGGAAVLALLLGAFAVVRIGGQPRSHAAGSLAVTSTPPGAELILDGRASGLRTPHTLEGLRPSAPVRVGVTLPGHVSAPRELRVSLAEGQSTRAHFALRQARVFRVESQPPGAAVQVDGARVAGATPLELEPIPLGESATLTITLEDHLPARLVLRAEAATATVARVELLPSRSIGVVSEPPGATVMIDGDPRGVTPLYEVAVPLDVRFELRLTRRGCRPWSRTIAARSLGVEPVSATLVPVPLASMPLTPDERREARRLELAMKDLRARTADRRAALKRANARLARAEADPRALAGPRAEALSGVTALEDELAALTAELAEAEFQIDALRAAVLDRLGEPAAD